MIYIANALKVPQNHISQREHLPHNKRYRHERERVFGAVALWRWQDDMLREIPKSAHSIITSYLLLRQEIKPEGYIKANAT